MDKHGYPTDSFLVAHWRFIDAKSPSGYTWGSITDGPQTSEEDLIDEIVRWAYEDNTLPSRKKLRVWEINPNGTSEDCTDWAIKTATQVIEDKEEDELSFRHI
jgi:hypothetical protein